jgi:hypothetical protein
MPKKKQSRMGRPPMKAEKRRSVLLTVRFMPAEYRQLAADAKAAGRSIVEHLRQCWRERRVSDGRSA